MTWQPGDDPVDEPYVEERDPPEPIPPWRAAAPTTPSVKPVEVLVEAYDDELPTPSRSEQASSAVRRGWAGIGPATRHVLSLAVFAAAVIGALAGIGVAWIHVMGDPLADAHAYYEAAQRLNNGQPLYPPGIDPSGNHIYLYPPLFAIVLRPLALLPYEAFALAWELIVIGSLILLLRYLGLRRRATWLGLGILGIPIGWAVTVAQAHVPMTYLLALGQPWSIAIAANLKLTPVLIAIWWLGRRDYQSFLAFLVWSALFVAAQLLLDFQDSVAYFQRIGFEQLGQVRNISPYVQSPVLWVALLLGGALVTLALARTRWGWAAAVFLATLAPPRLLIYMLTGLMAALRQPRIAGEVDPDDRSDPSAVYVRSAR